MGQLHSGNFDVIHNDSLQEKSDAVVINTCGFIEDAKQESIDTILSYLRAKEEGQVGEVFVMGCLSERYISELEKEIPDVDRYFGVNDLEQVVRSLGGEYKYNLVGERLQTTPVHFAYMKISEGCDRRCTFCAIPSIRGKHNSRPEEELIGEARRLAARGVKELILIGQDLTYYGVDLYRENRFTSLLKNLSGIRGLEWIRLHYAYPAGFPLEVLDLIRETPNICRYIDMPIQHINNRILSLMQRGHTQEGTVRLLEQIREKLPDAALRTTLIVGFPGETDAEFKELLDFVDRFRFDRLGVFTYSHEEGTTAFKLQDSVPEHVKKERQEQIMALQQSVSYSLNQEKVGKTFKTVIDRQEGAYYVGRTQYDSPEVDNEVLIPASGNSLKTGRFYPVFIEKADDFDLYGKISHP
jgi:ribosomal protein S12 methylthiotransferase